MRQGKSVDVFSFSLVLFYCLTGGRHAFGESYERDFNIMQVPLLPSARMTCGHSQQTWVASTFPCKASVTAVS